MAGAGRHRRRAQLFDIVGAGQPAWYVPGVKLGFCAVSLAIPAGMYFFARRHFGERSARAALLAGVFWYELAGFAHKPMTEFVSTALLLALLALAVRPDASSTRTVWQAALLAVLAAAIRVQYAAPAVALFGVLLVRTKRRWHLLLAAAIVAVGVGVFDAITWGGGLFHSYITNVRFNLVVAEGRAGESPAYQYLAWLVLCGGGLSALAAVAALFRPRRYGFLLALAALILALHSLQAHKEYRFVFAVIPIWLLVGSDMVGELRERCSRSSARRGCCVPVRCGFSRRAGKRTPQTVQRVQGLVPRDRSGGVRRGSGSRFRGIPVSCKRPGRQGGVAG